MPLRVPNSCFLKKVEYEMSALYVALNTNMRPMAARTIINKKLTQSKFLT